MYTTFKNLLLTCFAIFIIGFMQPGCKKEDKFPAQSLPKITVISPESAIPGTEVTIKGSNLQNVSTIRFGTTEASFDAASVTDTSITALVPDSLAPGDLYVQVYVGDGEAYAAKNFTILEIPKIPTISSINPEKALPGEEVSISGINFTNTSSVTFGNISADFTVSSDTKLNVIVPAAATGGIQVITVSAPTGSDTVSFTVDLSPVVSSFTPDKAKEGDIVTVTGVRFTGAISVKLGSLETTFTVTDDNTITFTVPAGALTGLVSVTTPKGSGSSSSNLVVSVAGFKLIIYDDVISNFDTWGGWGGTADYSNTSTVETGANSIQVHYVGQWGSPIQLGNGVIDLTQYSTFKISIYGGSGTAGRTVNIGFNGSDGKSVTIAEGAWADFEIPISEISSATSLSQLTIKEYSGVAGVDEIIYVDNIGLN